MKEKWERWKPVEGLAEKYLIDSIVDENNTLAIVLSGEKDDQKRVEISFNDSVLGHRYTNESYRFGMVSYLNKDYGINFYTGWTFFKVTDSEYLFYFSKKLNGDMKKEVLIHFSFITPEEVIDIVADREPIVEFID